MGDEVNSFKVELLLYKCHLSFALTAFNDAVCVAAEAEL